jgi:hypothetical protein
VNNNWTITAVAVVHYYNHEGEGEERKKFCEIKAKEGKKYVTITMNNVMRWWWRMKINLAKQVVDDCRCCVRKKGVEKTHNWQKCQFSSTQCLVSFRCKCSLIYFQHDERQHCLILLFSYHYALYCVWEWRSWSLDMISLLFFLLIMHKSKTCTKEMKSPQKSKILYILTPSQFQ